MRKAKADNPQLLSLISFLEKAAKENDAPVWATVAEALSKTRRRRATVNLSQINRHTRKAQMVAVAGKVLGSGTLDHPVAVAAFTFSAAANRKIKSARGKCLTFPELVKKNPKGSDVRIVG
jgi:large subunit ribosomal protein L18e